MSWNFTHKDDKRNCVSIKTMETRSTVKWDKWQIMSTQQNNGSCTMFKSRDSYNITKIRRQVLSFHDFNQKITKIWPRVVDHTHVSIGTEIKNKKYLFL